MMLTQSGAAECTKHSFSLLCPIWIVSSQDVNDSLWILSYHNTPITLFSNEHATDISKHIFFFKLKISPPQQF